MNFTERAIAFNCGPDTLIGVLTIPQAQASLGVLVVVGGPQYRAGSHRHFVLLARALAKAGIAVMRFDYRGMGDSGGEQRDFSAASADIGAAIDEMQQRLPSITRIALWGLCDGASAALLYCEESRDQRVGGLCLLNPWVRSTASLARAHVKHYYSQRLRQKEFWLKLLSGKVAGAALSGLWRNVRTMVANDGTASVASQQPFQQLMAQAWSKFPGSVLLLLSGDDYTAKEFLEYAAMDKHWAGLLDQDHVLRHDLPQADHTFSNAQARSEVENLTLAWLQSKVAR